MKVRLFLIWLASISVIDPVFSQEKGLPHLAKHENAIQLVVDGEPWLMLACM
jgi:hypothetical protein